MNQGGNWWNSFNGRLVSLNVGWWRETTIIFIELCLQFYFWEFTPPKPSFYSYTNLSFLLSRVGPSSLVMASLNVAIIWLLSSILNKIEEKLHRALVGKCLFLFEWRFIVLDVEFPYAS